MILDKGPFKYKNKYCQHGEEEILLSIFESIGHRKTLCDIGARVQLSNSRRLIEDFGYTGTLIDANEKACADIERILGGEGITVINEKITIENVNDFVDADFLSIDIDTNDWWVWAHLRARPRVVCIEFNNHLDGLSICPYDPDMTKCNGGTKTQNASFDAFVMLGKLKGYTCVAQTGINTIFVDEQIQTTT